MPVFGPRKKDIANEGRYFSMLNFNILNMHVYLAQKREI